jgi:broad specificity phosphatase PhoE
MKILMIRHPVTAANVAGVIPKNSAGEITERGAKQISLLLRRLTQEPIDKIYSSDAERCKILTEQIALPRGITPIYCSLFREIDGGEQVGCKKIDLTQRYIENPNYKPISGESIEDLSSRAREGLNRILSGGGDKNVLVSHGWFLKMFLGIQLEMSPINSIKSLKFSNCALSEVTIENGKCIVEYLNNRDYLQ